jgi:hypothetical protein
MTQLYVIAQEYNNQLEKLMSLDLDETTLADTIEGLSGELEVKATNVAMFIRNLESTADQIKLAEAAMAARRKILENKAESIKNYLLKNMQLTGISKIESPYFALTIKKNPPKLVIDDAGQIPTEMYIYPPAPPPHPDNAKIKEALKNGEVIAGAHLEQGERLEIK